MQEEACLQPLRGQRRRLRFGFQNSGHDNTLGYEFVELQLVNSIFIVYYALQETP